MVKMMLVLAGRKDLWINMRSKPCSAPGWNTMKGEDTIPYYEFLLSVSAPPHYSHHGLDYYPIRQFPPQSF